MTVREWTFFFELRRVVCALIERPLAYARGSEAPLVLAKAYRAVTVRERPSSIISRDRPSTTLYDTSAWATRVAN
jgi:hypothetical protein